MYMLRGQAVWTCSVDMQRRHAAHRHGHGLWTRSTDMKHWHQNRNTKLTCMMRKQYDHAARIWNIDMQHAPAA
jgi:hypothetical protein